MQYLFGNIFITIQSTFRLQITQKAWINLKKTKKQINQPYKNGAITGNALETSFL